MKFTQIVKKTVSLFFLKSELNKKLTLFWENVLHNPMYSSKSVCFSCVIIMSIWRHKMKLKFFVVVVGGSSCFLSTFTIFCEMSQNEK